AVARGARIYAELAGYGVTCDAYHLTSPDPAGTGGARAIALALADAGMRPDEVSYYNAHGTSTQINDPTETLMVKHAFGDHARKLAISSTKSMTDYRGGVGEYCGGTLGFPAIKSTFERLAELFTEGDVDRVFLDLEQQEERLVKACDKYLLRFDPPSVAIFAGFSYARHVAATLERYMDADIRCIGSRNTPGESKYPVELVTGIDGVRALIGRYNPDLVLGSSFERSVCTTEAFSGITSPLRGSVRIAPTPFAGINGTLSLVEQVLNTCMDKKYGL
ncbi:MAG: nitrogenase component 1, partial [Methanomicrobiales archaeon]